MAPWQLSAESTTTGCGVAQPVENEHRRRIAAPSFGIRNPKRDDGIHSEAKTDSKTPYIYPSLNVRIARNWVRTQKPGSPPIQDTANRKNTGQDWGRTSMKRVLSIFRRLRCTMYRSGVLDSRKFAHPFETAKRQNRPPTGFTPSDLFNYDSMSTEISEPIRSIVKRNCPFLVSIIFNLRLG